MFIGHYAIGFGVKPLVPRVSLGTLFLAAQFIDLLWPILVIAGIEHVGIEPGNTAMTPLDFYDYPISHSLLMVMVWGLLIGGLHYWRKREKRTAVILGGVVLSHWVLDFLVHGPDLPLAPGWAMRVGLGLWNYPMAELPVEGLLYLGGLIVYLRTTKAMDRTGRRAFWILALILAVIFIMNILGPPPPSAMAIGYSGLGMWLFIAWAYWVDRHRTPFIRVASPE
jgi:hypothetical protein